MSSDTVGPKSIPRMSRSTACRIDTRLRIPHQSKSSLNTVGSKSIPRMSRSTACTAVNESRTSRGAPSTKIKRSASICKMMVFIALLHLCSAATDDTVYTPLEYVESPQLNFRYTNDLTHRWIESQLGKDGFIKIEDPDEEILNLLNWKVTGFSICRKLQKDWAEELEKLKIHTFTNYEELASKDNADYYRFYDQMMTENKYESWFIYVRVHDPRPDATSEARYIKLWFGGPGEYDRCVDSDTRNAIVEHIVRTEPFVRDGYHKALMIYEDWEGDKSIRGFAKYSVQGGTLNIVCYKNFDYETKNEGCKIRSLIGDKKPDEADLENLRTLSDVIHAARFPNANDDTEFGAPTYVSPDFWGDGTVPTCNCTTYAMRVAELLEIEKNPLRWSYLNKKRGRVFKVSELNHGDRVYLDDHYGEFVLVKPESSDGKPEVLKAKYPDNEETVELSTYKVDRDVYVREIHRLKSPESDLDIGPQKKGAPRVNFWAVLNEAPLFDYKSREKKRVTIKSDLTSNTYHHWSQVMHSASKESDCPLAGTPLVAMEPIVADKETYRKLMITRRSKGPTELTFFYTPFWCETFDSDGTPYYYDAMDHENIQWDKPAGFQARRIR